MRISGFRKFSLLLVGALSALVGIGCASDIENSDVDNIRKRSHQIPDWYDDAKLGIFIHWGPASVPAFAAGEKFKPGELEKFFAEATFPTEVPYAEWYWFSLQNPEGKTRKYHIANYGEGARYQDFGAKFASNVRNWDPDKWAQQFTDVGAEYVVLVSKHHDGYNLWPSTVNNPNIANWHSERDLVGELAEALRKKGMRFGTYYSTGLDWSFHMPKFDRDIGKMVYRSAPTSQAYADYVHAQMRELIDRYKPDVLWADIGYPSKGRREELLEYYYKTVPDGVINDRWVEFDKVSGIAQLPGGMWLLKVLGALSGWFGSESSAESEERLGFQTKEYTNLPEILPHKWESTRGVGASFGYNRVEDAEDMLNSVELVEYLVDTVSKNGNLLINVGPDSYGSIPEIQMKPLNEMGEWLKVNGAAIYGTRPWKRFGTLTRNGTKIRFTQDDDSLYLVVLERGDSQIIVPDIDFVPKAARILGGQEVPFQLDGSSLVVGAHSLSEGPIPAYVVRLSK